MNEQKWFFSLHVRSREGTCEWMKRKRFHILEKVGKASGIKDVKLVS